MNKCFPNTKAYLVNFMGGTAGHFIGSLIYLLTVKDADYKFSSFGNAHNIIFQHAAHNIKYVPSMSEYNKKFYCHEPIFNFVEPILDTIPIVLTDHCFKGRFDFFLRYPLGKMIIITCEDDDIPRILGNIYFKNICEAVAQGDISVWLTFKETNKIFEKYNHPKEVPNNIIEEYINQPLYPMGFVLPYSFFTPPIVIPNQHKESILLITMHDIFYNQSQILTQISKFIDAPITPYAKKFYDNYLTKQDELVIEHMPWLNDK